MPTIDGRIITPSALKNPNVPPVFDTVSLAAELGTNAGAMWYYILNPKEGYTTFEVRQGKKCRTIHAPNPGVKYYSTNLLRRILDPLNDALGDHVTAYRRGRTIRDAVVQHIPECPICDASYPMVAPKHPECPRRGTYIHLDLRDFFHSTSRTMVRGYFQQLGFSRYVAGMLASLCTLPINGRYGVPQGNPVSWALCNVVADLRLDGHIKEYVANLNTHPRFSGAYRWVYTRYSDDMAFTCGRIMSHGEIREIVQDLYKIIRTAGYTPNMKKTRWIRTHHTKRLLGSLIHQIPNCSKSHYDRVKGILGRCRRHGIEPESVIAAEHHGIPNLQAWLVGNINWINQLNPRRGAKLKTLLHRVQEKT